MTEKITIYPGVTLWAIRTDKFKTGCFSISFLRPHDRANAALDALLPAVLFRATERYPDMPSITARLDTLYGSSFGVSLRQRGEVKLVGFYSDFIEDDFLPEGEKVFVPMVEFLEDVLYRPFTENGIFSEEFVEGEKKNLIDAIDAAQNDKRGYAWYRLRQLMCENENYGVPRLGYTEDVKKITAQALWDHYQEVLSTSEIRLFYVGRQDPQEVAAQFRRILRAPERITPTGTVIIPRAETVRTFSESKNITQGKLCIGLRTGITGTDPDHPALILLNAVFGSGVTSKLFVNVREKRSLCYYASSSLDKHKGIMLISSGIEFKDYEVARDAILAELEACRCGDITDTELEDSRRHVLSNLRSSLDAPARLDDYYMSGGDNTEEIEVLMQKISALTREDLMAAAAKITTDSIFFLKGVES